jgi:polyhydroxyalkanoate synthesis regulator protein
MQSFAGNQERLREYLSKTVGGIFPFEALSQMGKQNLGMMEQAMKMFAPFGAGQPGEGEASENQPTGEELANLRRRLDAIEREIGGLGKPAGGKS